MSERDGRQVASEHGRPCPAKSGSPSSWTPTASELIEVLRRRHESRQDAPRVRRHQRQVWRARLSLTMLAGGALELQGRPVKVSTCDLSAQGFSFLYDAFVYPGTIVYTRFESLPGRPLMKGIVRHCTHVEGRRHRVGVEFVPLDADAAMGR